MPLVKAQCTNCGANLEVDSSKDAAICPHCGTAYIVEKAINHYINGSGESDFDKLWEALKGHMNLGNYSMALQVARDITVKYPQRFEGWYGVVASDIREKTNHKGLNQNLPEEYSSEALDNARKLADTIQKNRLLDSALGTYRSFIDSQKRQQLADDRAFVEKLKQPRLDTSDIATKQIEYVDSIIRAIKRTCESSRYERGFSGIVKPEEYGGVYIATGIKRDSILTKEHTEYGKTYDELSELEKTELDDENRRNELFYGTNFTNMLKNGMRRLGFSDFYVEVIEQSIFIQRYKKIPMWGSVCKYKDAGRRKYVVYIEVSW